MGQDLVDSQPRSGDASGDADAVIGGSTYGQSRLIGNSGPDSSHPFQVPDAVLRQPAAPSAHPRIDRLVDDSGRAGKVGRCQRDKFGVVTLQDSLLAEPAD